MAEDKRSALAEDLIEGLAHGEVAEAAEAFSIRHVGDGEALEVDLGDPDMV